MFYLNLKNNEPKFFNYFKKSYDILLEQIKEEIMFDYSIKLSLTYPLILYL